ncbi:MAG: hypothetical protein JKY70_10980 [Mucilaginibacter sp.]|nr:hypothetical protein [Mucilaginibacter sp.]
MDELNEPHISNDLKNHLNEAVIKLRSQGNVLLDLIVRLGETDSANLANSSVDFLESKFENILQPGFGFQLIYLYDYLFLADCMMAETRRLSGFLLPHVSTDAADLNNLYDSSILHPTINFLKTQFQSTLVS